MNLSPIVLFVYNRPIHTQRTLDALAINLEAKDSNLYIFCDGPKHNSNNDELNRTKEVVRIINNEQRFKKVDVTIQKENMGLASSILTGVTKIVNEYGKIIVLEDDMVTSKQFLAYMNHSLNYYKNEPRVFHINGFNNQSSLQFMLDDYYFLKYMHCWGWATWKDRWQNLNKDYSHYYDKLINDQELMSKFNYENSLNFQEQLLLNINKKINTWAILWYATIFFNNAYCLTSKYSYVNNIGLDGSGGNCVKTNFHDININENIKPFRGNLEIKEKYKSRLHHKLFYEFGKNFKIHRYVYRRVKKLF